MEVTFEEHEHVPSFSFNTIRMGVTAHHFCHDLVKNGRNFDKNISLTFGIEDTTDSLLVLLFD